MKFSDKDILEHIQSGKESRVLEYLYTNCYPKMRRFVLSRGGSEDDAKDIFQDAVMTFFTKVINGVFDTKYSVQPFIIGVSKNLWIDKFRKQRRITLVEDPSTIDHEVINQYDYVFDQERTNIIQDVLSTVGDTCKQLLVNVIYHRMSMKEIAAEMGYQNIDSAKTQHYKCRQKLIKKFKDNDYLKQLLKG